MIDVFITHVEAKCLPILSEEMERRNQSMIFYGFYFMYTVVKYLKIHGNMFKLYIVNIPYSYTLKMK